MGVSITTEIRFNGQRSVVRHIIESVVSQGSDGTSYGGGPADFNAFDFDGHGNTARWPASSTANRRCYSANRCGVPILQSDVLAVDVLGFYVVEGFRIACFVIAVGVFGGNGEAARMEHAQAVAAVLLYLDFSSRVGRGPYLRGGEGIPRRSRDFAAYRCGGGGRPRRVIAGMEQENREQQRKGCEDLKKYGSFEPKTCRVTA